MAYGFKLTGITIPDGTTAINAVISDGTTPTEYTLTGSVADGFSGTGASLSIPAIKLDDDAAVITADSRYNIDAEVSAWLENLTPARLERNDVYVNGIRLPFQGQAGVYLYVDGDIVYAVVPPREEGQRAMFGVSNVSTKENVPGTYHLVIYDGPATFNLTINALTAEDVGDSYNVNVYTTEVTESFKTAVETVLEESGQSSGKRGICVSLQVTSGNVSGVYIDDEETTLENLFDYGWENVSQIRISEDGNTSAGTFLLQVIQNTPSVTKVMFGTLSLPGVISSTVGYGYIEYITIDSDGRYTKAYSGTISITTH